MTDDSLETRVALLKQSHDAISATVASMDTKLDNIIELMAEARGAAKMGKFISHILTAVIGALGGAGASAAMAKASEHMR